MYKKFPCYYPGDFNPPTKFHLNTVEWLLSRPEIGHVYIVVGNHDKNQLYQEKKVELWEMLIKSAFSPNISIIKSKEDHQVQEIKNVVGKKKEAPFYIALTEKMGRNMDLQKAFEEFKHYQMEIIPSQFNASSKQLIDAVVKGDKATVKTLLPDNITEKGVEDYIEILKKGQDPEAPQENSPYIDYKNQYINKFNDGFWTNVFTPMVNESISYKEALNDFDALQTVLDNKRDIAFLVKGAVPKSDWIKMQEMIKEGGLKTMFVKGNPYEAYVVYRPGKENDATELKDIAEKYGGYLHKDASPEDTRRIGKLLSYHDGEVEDFIKKNAKK